MIVADYHMHTSFSADSETDPELMIQESIRRGLQKICITDHEDKDFQYEGIPFSIDTESYFKRLTELKEQYRDKIQMGIGVEIGLQTDLADLNSSYIEEHPFDFVIGSLHLIDKMDPYDKIIFQGRRDEDVYLQNMEETLKNIKATDCFDVLGHMDYVVRYGAAQEKNYRPADMKDVIDEILRYLIENGKGIEINSAGLKYGLPFAHPHPFILSRYRELGGEILTIGSDAHKPEHIGFSFKKVEEMLKYSGFSYYTVFTERKPQFIQLT